MLHKVRLMLNRQLVMVTNAVRTHKAEFGVVAPIGRVASFGCSRSSMIKPTRRSRHNLQMLVARLKLLKLENLKSD